MRRLRYLTLPSLLLTMLAALPAHATPWLQDTGFDALNANGNSAKGDAADLDGDGTIDLVFVNTFGYNKGDPMGSDAPQQAFLNAGGGAMMDVSDTVFGPGQSFNGRAVKLRDLDYDGDNDIILGTTWISQSQIYINDGSGNFTNETATHLPQMLASVGDVEVGDVDYDGDLDLALSNWGSDVVDEQADAAQAGGVTLLWRQVGGPYNIGEQGTGMFEDLTPANMPNIELRWSWDIEYVDIDNDWDLDLVLSCFACEKSVWIYGNDGTGKFANIPADNIAGKGAPDVEPMDLTGDGFIDLVTLQDGTNRRNRVLVNNGNGGYTINNDDIWPALQNPTSFDFSGAFYDFDSDKDPDLVLGAFQTATKYPDRLMINDGGKLSQWDGGNLPKYQALEHVPTPTNASPGTYHIALADFTGDHKLDVAMAQAENANDKLVFFATAEVADDTAPPILGEPEDIGVIQFGETEVIRIRVHDNKSPLMLHDFTQDEGFPYVEGWPEDPGDPELNPGDKSIPGQWYGEYLWRIAFQVPDSDIFFYRICAIDAAGNKACTPIKNVPVEGGTETESDSNTMTESDTDGTVSDSMTETDSLTNVTVTNTDGTVSDSITDGTVSDSITDGTVSDSITDGTVSDSITDGTVSNSNSMSEPTESFGSMEGGPNTNTMSDSMTDTDTVSDSNNSDAGQLDDDGCGCSTSDSPARGVLASFALLGLLGIRRRRR